MIVITIFSSKNINIISLIITFIIFLILSLFINKPLKNNSLENQNIISQNIEKTQKENENETDNLEITQDLNWYIEIPVINLKAPIKETTNMDILNNYVGHFEETSLTNGNVGLAGHNRGYENNYFENVKLLKKGDEIKYKYEDFEKTYIVDKIEVIKNTDWSYLENSKENKITLITCVEDKPDLRRCVQATEK